MYQKHKGEAEFFLIYIREAHPDSVLEALVDGQKKLVKIGQSDDLASRKDNAKMCVATMKLSIPTLLDKADNRVNLDYAGWPDRMYVVGVDGKIAYKGGVGPRGFKVEEVTAWLEKLPRQ